MGDLLFAIANLSRKLGIEPETALRHANDKFTSRFRQLEQRGPEGLVLFEGQQVVGTGTGRAAIATYQRLTLG